MKYRLLIPEPYNFTDNAGKGKIQNGHLYWKEVNKTILFSEFGGSVLFNQIKSSV